MSLSSHTPADVLSETAFAQISTLARDEAGLVLPDSKKTMVQSRLRHRVTALGLGSYDAYVNLVTSGSGESERRNMISALTTNVSHFFREKHHFDILTKQALPLLQTKARAGKPVRIWSAGCSSGQEPYSIAMSLLHSAPDLAGRDVLILATDIDPNILEKADNGTYSDQQISGVPQEMRKKYFEVKQGQHKVSAAIKKMIRFRELNLLRDWPMKSPFDIVFCRNVVIYFDAETQSRLWPRFDAALIPEGWLFLGHSERVSDDCANRFSSAGMTAYRSTRTAPSQNTQLEAS